MRIGKKKKKNPCDGESSFACSGGEKRKSITGHKKGLSPERRGKGCFPASFRKVASPLRGKKEKGQPGGIPEIPSSTEKNPAQHPR